jgi:hypothetical protein
MSSANKNTTEEPSTMKLERTTKKGNKTTVLAEQMQTTTWKGVVTLTAETATEYLQVRMTADELRAMLALVEGK